MLRHASRYSPDADLDRRVRLRAKVFSDLQQLLPILGLILLTIGVVQVLFCYVPVNFASPLWEYDLFGHLVACAWLPLLGLALILIPFSKTCTFWHLKIRGAMGWVALAAGIAGVLLVPYGIISTTGVQSALQTTATANNPDQALLGLGAESVRAYMASSPIRTGNPQEDLRMLKIALWGASIRNATLSLLAAAGFLLLFFKTGVYRYLLHQDAIGKGEHVGITREPFIEEDD